MRALATAAALVLVLGGMAVAGDYHSGSTLSCQDCHIMHGSQQHNYNADGGGFATTIGGAAPYDFLLRNTVNALCLSCHDGSSFAPDVLGTNGGVVLATGRQAGALNMTNTSPYFDADGHTLGSPDNAPGGTGYTPGAHGLECTNCHQPHGYGGPTANPYRNLSPFSGAPGSFHPSVTYAVGANDPLVDVFERVAAVYDISNIDFNEPSQTASGYGAWCQTCHTDFHGASTDANMRNQAGPAGEEWVRHPTADADIGAIGGGHSQNAIFEARLYRTQVMSGSGAWGTQGSPFVGAPTDLTPSCFTCHKSHGNQNAFGLILPTGAAPINEQGDGAAYRELCKQCHGQGG